VPDHGDVHGTCKEGFHVIVGAIEGCGLPQSSGPLFDIVETVKAPGSRSAAASLAAAASCGSCAEMHVVPIRAPATWLYRLYRLYSSEKRMKTNTYQRKNITGAAVIFGYIGYISGDVAMCLSQTSQVAERVNETRSIASFDKWDIGENMSQAVPPCLNRSQLPAPLKARSAVPATPGHLGPLESPPVTLVTSGGQAA